MRRQTVAELREQAIMAAAQMLVVPDGLAEEERPAGWTHRLLEYREQAGGRREAVLYSRRADACYVVEAAFCSCDQWVRRCQLAEPDELDATGQACCKHQCWLEELRRSGVIPGLAHWVPLPPAESAGDRQSAAAREVERVFA